MSEETAFWLLSIRDPCLQEGERDRQHYRSDKEADDPEGDEAADNSGEDQQQRQIHPLLDKNRTDKVINRSGEDCHDEKDRPQRACPDQ